MHHTLKTQTKILQPSKHNHAKHPTPSSFEIATVGKVMSLKEWNKFSKRYLYPKLEAHCHRKKDGSLGFTGDFGLDALLEFHKRYPNRFHFKITGSTKEQAVLAARFANRQGITFQELCYRDYTNKVISLHIKS